MAHNKSETTLLIKTISKELGFYYCGISEAIFLEEEAPRLENYLKNNMHGKMGYLENYFDKRLDPRLLVPGARSVVSLLFNYYPQQTLTNSRYKISKYAYGEDYHFIIKDKLNELMLRITEKVGEINGRAFVDSAPVLDKAWAKRSGLGWVGKNALLINPKAGSFFFVAELILDLELDYDTAIKDYCGSCTRCIDACPTGAIEESHIVNGSKCISYFTIELKEAIDEGYKGKFDDWIFGCDICQDVCPWNRFSTPHNEPRLNTNPELFSFTDRDWEEISSDIFNQVFKKSAVKRTKLIGLQRNITFVK
ncbi:MAG: tRNA epoxyqueuosine(34) reductase QueG [Bacteroidia bacterium]|nr:tRNA epoxyqueuosine(34) reductase QueG [Bacteroidia bacterium]